MEALQFNKIVNEESNRLENLCMKWQHVLESSHYVTDDLQDQIRTAVGQTKLLIKEKLQQFRELLKNYENGRGDINVTKNDLEGFWDLILIQVNELNQKFSDLEVTSLVPNTIR